MTDVAVGWALPGVGGRKRSRESEEHAKPALALAQTLCACPRTGEAPGGDSSIHTGSASCARPTPTSARAAM
eukprot:881182-Prymnesium_polylepis.2